MSSNLLGKNDEEYITTNSEQPVYKNKLFIFAGFAIGLIILIVIIAVTATSSKKKKEKDEDYLNFKTTSFEEITLGIKNPDQGFYRPTTVYLTPEGLKYEENLPEQVYLYEIDISAFSGAVNGNADIELTSKALTELDNLFNETKKLNLNAVVRFSYDPGVRGNKNKEASMEMIEKHIKQISPIINKHLDTITGIQAGMLGPYGEMHSSTIATDENKALVFKYWLENTKEVPVFARTPKAIFVYFNKTLDEMENFTILPTTKEYRLGLFNDGYLHGGSDDDDDGTYRYNRTREINWLSHQNDHLPYGGETNHESSRNDLVNCVPEMFTLSLSYLNIEYHEGVLKKWNTTYYDKNVGNDTLFYGVTGLAYINAHLGYRFVILSLEVKYIIGSKFEAILNVKNVGFGNLNRIKKLGLVYTDYNNGTIIERKENIGQFKGENSINISGKLFGKEQEKYKISLLIYSSIEEGVVYYPIQFANKDVFDKKISANYLFSVENGKLLQ